MEVKNRSSQYFNHRLRGPLVRRLLSASIILSMTVFLPSSNFAALRNLKKTPANSSAPTRSMKLRGHAVTPLTISPSVISVSPAANSGTVNVLNASREEWSVSNTVPWITVTVPASRSETSQQITYTVNPNSSCANRVGVFYVKTKAVTISQAGLSADYSLSTETASIAPEGGGLNVTLNANCLWTVRSDANWITILSPLNGSDNSTLSYLVAANGGSASRTGTIRVFDGNSVLRKTLSVTQASVPPSHSLSSLNAVFTSTGGAGNVTLTALAAWSVQSDVDWITDISPVSGGGSATISYTVTANPDQTARNGRIKILDGNSVVKQILVVGQSSATASYSLGSSSATFTSSGGNSNVQLFANSAWTIQSDVPWINGFSQTSGVGDRGIGYSVTANPGCTSRTGQIKILDGNSVVQKKLTVTQAGISGEYALSSTYLLFPSTGGRISVGVSARCGWTVQSDVSWISNIAPASGSGNTTVFYTVEQNTTPDGRQGFIRLLDADSVVQQTLKVVQTGVAPTYWLYPTSAGFPASGSSNNLISLTANSTWIAQADVSWITGLTPASGTTNAVLRYGVSPNTNSSSRVGSINIYDGTLTLRETFSVVQSGASGSAPTAGRPSDSYSWSAKNEDGTTTAIDGDGNTYVAGQFSGAIDFGGGVLASSDADIFLVKYAADGTHLWSKSFGGTGEDFVEAIALNQGTVLMVGSFASQINFGSAAENQLSGNGAPGIFFSNLSGEAGQYVWSQPLGDFSNLQANPVIMNYLSRAAQP